ncbi:MAG TPA: hypothetical protein VKH19_15835 [Gemmatimonadaceae bacterium]|nr:hypothetical protein [Gemmatimonadaceae bacterium]
MLSVVLRAASVFVGSETRIVTALRVVAFTVMLVVPEIDVGDVAAAVT